MGTHVTQLMYVLHPEHVGKGVLSLHLYVCLGDRIYAQAYTVSVLSTEPQEIWHGNLFKIF